MKRLLPKYQGQPGKNQGYYPSYTATSNNYNLLSQDYANSDEQGLLTTDQFTAGLFDKELSTYKSMSADTAPTVISNVTATDLNLSLTLRTERVNKPCFLAPALQPDWLAQSTYI